MRVLAGGAVRSGEAVELADCDVSGRAVVRAIRGDASPVTVDCPAPGTVHEYVGHVHGSVDVPVRAALAAVARQRGLTAPQDEELAAVGAELDALDPPAVDLSTPRERVAGTDDDEVAELRETVAAHRGALQARERLDADTAPARERLEAAVGRLSDRETDHVAAEQALDRARDEARTARDVRDRRLELQDRAGNLRRAAREHLAGELRDEFAVAVEAVPGDGRVPGRPAAFEDDAVTAALAVARLADLRAPLVLEVDRFPTALAARECLDAPVITL